MTSYVHVWDKFIFQMWNKCFNASKTFLKLLCDDLRYWNGLWYIELLLNIFLMKSFISMWHKIAWHTKKYKNSKFLILNILSLSRLVIASNSQPVVPNVVYSSLRPWVDTVVTWPIWEPLQQELMLLISLKSSLTFESSRYVALEMFSLFLSTFWNCCTYIAYWLYLE